MKTAAAFSLLVASAAAFAPASVKVSKTALSGAASGPFDTEIGVQAPLGYWDPLGLLASGEQEQFDRLRSTEIKHGRIAQLAVVGYLTTEYGYRLPGDIDYSGTAFADIPGGFAALSAMPTAGLVQIVAFVTWLEIAGWKQDKSSYPGDFSATSAFPVGWVSPKFTEEQKLDYRIKELNQGRAAQMGILALMVHEQLGVPILPEL